MDFKREVVSWDLQPHRPVWMHWRPKMWQNKSGSEQKTLMLGHDCSSQAPESTVPHLWEGWRSLGRLSVTLSSLSWLLKVCKEKFCLWLYWSSLKTFNFICICSSTLNKGRPSHHPHLRRLQILQRFKHCLITLSHEKSLLTQTSLHPTFRALLWTLHIFKKSSQQPNEPPFYLPNCPNNRINEASVCYTHNKRSITLILYPWRVFPYRLS